MALDRFFDNITPPPAVAWPDTVQWSIQSSAKTTLRLLNEDGTYTVLRGTGFALDADGEPTAGTVVALKRLAADGTTILERISDVNIALDDLRKAFGSGGFVDTVFAGDDHVVGTDQSRFFADNLPREFFRSGAGDDVVHGGGGSDEYLDGAGSDTYVGGTVSSNIDFIYDAVDYGDSPFAVHVFLTGGIGSSDSWARFNGSADVDTLVNIETLTGSPGNDVFTVSPSFVNKEGTGRTWINGGPGNDLIIGNGEVLLYYFDGDEADGIYVDLGLGIAQSLQGTPEEDRANIGVDHFSGVYAVVGTDFDDRLIGSDDPGAELFDGSGGNDFIDGGGGEHDRYQIETPPVGVVIDLSGPVGFANLNAPGESRDKLVNIEEVTATEFDDSITMSDADNVAIGKYGNDVIFGLAGNDRLVGDAGQGFYHTGPGDDVLVGGLGQDRLSGNRGADMFDFNAIAESRAGDKSRDLINDFSHSQGDRIDLATIDANTGVGGDQAFALIGDEAFHGVAGELRFAAGIVQGDIDGDGKADLEIKVVVAGVLVAADFVL